MSFTTLSDYSLIPTTIELRRPALGRSPTGFHKIRVDLLPRDLAHLIGYDPRAIQVDGRRKKKLEALPKNVAHDIIVLQQNVQRTIDQSRVDAMVEYLHNAIENEQFADWDEINIVTEAQPDMSAYEEHFVIRMPSSANYFVTDGQHRLCALLDFLQKYPAEAGKFTQPVSISVLPPDRVYEYAGQAFHDKNYLHAPVKVAKALSADTRDAHNRLTKDLHEHPLLQEAGGVNYQRDTLPPDSQEFTTHSVLYRFVRGFVEGRKGLERGAIDNPFLVANFDAIKADLFTYVNMLGTAFPSWKGKDREKYLSRSSAAFQSLGVLGHDLFLHLDRESDRMAMLSKIGEKKLNWARTNTETWSGVIGGLTKNKQAVSPGSSHQVVDSTIKFLRDKSGMSVRLKQVAEAEKEE